MRLYRGVDPRLVGTLTSKGITEKELEKFRSPIVFDGMPIQDAIDFSVFILQTTVNMARFEAGASSCGGPLWGAVITPSGFEWMQRPKWTLHSP